MKVMIVAATAMFAVLFAGTAPAWGQRIAVSNSRFMVDSRPIWLNAVNTPWDHWNDLGGDFDPTFWDQEFGRIRKAGGNAVRIWITCNGEVGFDLDSRGRIDGMTEKFWDDCDTLFNLARKHRIYVLATLISFDHTKDSHPNFAAWRAMYSDPGNVGLFVRNYVEPFAARYKDNPYLFAVEPCNEIEWVHEQHGIPWERLQYFCAAVAAAVHRGGSALVTVGNNAKWQSVKAEGEFFSDEALRKEYPDPQAYLDFTSPHWYDWVTRWYGSPFEDRTKPSYGLERKPSVIGECPAGADWVRYENAFRNGWDGVFAWTSNTVDENGGLDGRLGKELSRFRKAHPSLVTPVR